MGNNIVNNSGYLNGNIYQNQYPQPEERLGNPHQSREEDRETKESVVYDIAVSYASEQKNFVSRVVRILEQEGLHVFYAPDREADLTGHDMIGVFYNVYRYQSLYVACFISEAYLNKDITMHEAKTALVRERHEKRGCMIPISFEGAQIPDMNPDIISLNADKLREVEIADRLVEIVKKYKKSRA